VPDDCHDEQDRICEGMVSPEIIAPVSSGSWPWYIAFQGVRLRELTSGGGWPHFSRHFVVADEVVSRILEQSSTDENH
jgi:hypothetical protein